MQNNRLIVISAAGSRKATAWPQQTLWWSEFVSKLQTPVRGTETLATYLRQPKAQQDDLKDVGGFVGGAVIGARKPANVQARDLITLDMDSITTGETDEALRRLEALGCAYAVYSTRKHEPIKPRLRVIVPSDRPVTREEYEPIARRLAEYVSLDWCDPTTFQVARLMYWPSCSADSQYVYAYADKPFLSADGMLATYTDWQDIASWPVVPGAAAPLALAKKQGDPTVKEGIIGAFCRTYDIYRVLEELLPDTYIPGDVPDRYTYAGGSTTGGAMVYDKGLYLYSHHATDPSSGKLCNAFDLVRLHKFGDQDDDAQAGTPVNRLPSYKAMCGFAVADCEVSTLMAREEFGEAAVSTETAGCDWATELSRGENGIYKTLKNTLLIIQNAIELNGCARKDEFTGRTVAAEGLPWRESEGYWGDSDTTELRAHLETRYKYRPGKQDVKDAVVATAAKRQFHPVRDYLNALPEWDKQPRLDTLFIDYLGVKDCEYARAVSRKALVGAIARVMTPGCKFDHMVVFIGKQGRGKSSIIYKLAGGDDWFTDSVVTFDGQKAFEAVTGKWLVEVPEMHAFDKVTMNQAKAFISKQSDFFRAAYAEFPEDRRRQCAFFGTTNNKECLRDDTGGRRFWPLDTDAQDRKKDIFTDLAAERDQVWAEALIRWRAGEALFLPRELEEMAAAEQEDHREAHPWEDTIKNFIDQKIPRDWDSWDTGRRLAFWGGGAPGDIECVQRQWVCVREVWQEALAMPFASLDRQKAREITGVLNRIDGWERGGAHRFGGAYGIQKGFTRKAPT